MPKTARVSSQNLTVGVFIDDMSPPKLLEEAVQFGSPLQIPNIRALMEEMTFFESMQATIPICKASRASMFAGQTPMKTRVWDNEAEDYQLYDFTKSWVAKFKEKGQVDGIGKLTHEPEPNQVIIDACYTRMHVIVKNAAKAIEIVSQANITGTANQVFENVRLTPKTTVNGNADAAYCTITLDGAGTAIASVALTEKRDVDPITFVTAPAPRYELGVSGGRLSIDDTLAIDGLDYDPATGEYAMPDAELVVKVTELTSFFYYADEGQYEYGTFTQEGEVLKGDTLISQYSDIAFERIQNEIDLSRRLFLIGLKGPHTPLIPDQEFLDMHPLSEISIPDGYDVPSSYMLRYLLEDAATELYDAGKLEEFAQYYLAVVEELDARIGEIVQSLKDRDLWDRTNFFLWSDHSYAIGNQNSDVLQSGIHKKFKNFGTATCCFFGLRDPAYTVGAQIIEPVSSMDIGPTMLEMAGLPVPAYMEGKSLLPGIRKPAKWVNDRGAVSFCFGNLSIVKSVWTPNGQKPMRLIRMFNGEDLIYRDDIDPLNKTNLVARSAYARSLTELRAAMDTEMARLGLKVSGSSGSDLLMKYSGGGTLAGGSGDDTYIVGSPTITITDTGGDDQLIIQYSDQTITDIVVPSGIEKVFIDPTMAPSNVTISGSGGTTVVGTLNNALGGSGNDTIIVSGAGGSGLTAYGGGGDDSVSGTSGKNDSLYGGTGGDTLKGKSGDDVIDGGSGANRLGGGGGNDSLTGGTDNDSIFGGSDDDTIYGGGGADSLQGDSGSDVLYGGAGNDEVYGGQGADTLYGDGGDDIFRTGSGATTLYGGTGANIFQIGLLTGATSIMDYGAGTGNKTRFLPTLGLGGIDVSAATLLSNVKAAGSDSGGNFVLIIPETGAHITYVGKLEASFIEADFEVAFFEELDQPDPDDDGGGND